MYSHVRRIFFSNLSRTRALNPYFPMNTKFSKRLDIRTPICSAPMAGAAGGALAGAVTAGGGLGFIGAGYVTVDELKKEFDLARSGLNLPQDSPLPIGVGFLCWQLDTDIKHGKDLITFALDHKVKAIWFAFGDIHKWIRFVRDYDQSHGSSTIIFVQVGTVAEALLAVKEWNIDILVAQGIESGGHGYAGAPPLLTLVPDILSVIPENGPPLLAAGGLSTGSHVASLLLLGASGAVLGTRFLVAPESLYTDVQRKALVQASGNPTVRTMAFDHARGTLGWPEGVDGRALRNATVDDFDAGVDKDIIKTKFLASSQRQDPTRMLVWAGTGVNLISQVQPAKDIVQDLHRECLDRLNLFQNGVVSQ